MIRVLRVYLHTILMVSRVLSREYVLYDRVLR